MSQSNEEDPKGGPKVGSVPPPSQLTHEEIMKMQKEASKDGKNAELSLNSPNQSPCSSSCLDSDWWMVDPGSVTMEERIGKGSTADVFKGKWNGSVVAVKKFHDSRNSIKRELSAILRVATQAQHPNIVRFLCASISTAPYLLVQEFCAGGTLFHLLHKKKKGKTFSLALLQKLKMCLDIAQAMEYLHSLKPLMLHRDLKSLNLLLLDMLTSDSDTPFVKVTDFGLARAMPDNMESMTNKVGTIWWMAPEVLQTTHYDATADVYSFAIVAYEILTEEPPFTEMNPVRASINIINGERPDLIHMPGDVPASLTALLARSWAEDTADRPDFSEIVEHLNKLKDVMLAGDSKMKKHHKGCCVQ